jgi:hypothetical protein
MTGAGRHHQPAAPRSRAALRRLRAVYRLIVAVLAVVVAYAVATPAYAATSKHTHIYTIGRQSTLVGTVMILLICAVSIRRNLRRAPRLDQATEQ